MPFAAPCAAVLLRVNDDACKMGIQFSCGCKSPAKKKLQSQSPPPGGLLHFYGLAYLRRPPIRQMMMELTKAPRPNDMGNRGHWHPAPSHR